MRGGGVGEYVKFGEVRGGYSGERRLGEMW